MPRQCGRHGGRSSRRIIRTTRRSSLPRCKGEGPPPRGPQCMSATAVRTTRRSSLPADHADDAEVVPPAAMRTTRRSSLPAGHTDDTEVIPPGGAKGEGPPLRGPQCMSAAAMRTTRRSSLPRIMRTTRRSSLPRCKRGGSASARTAVHECCGSADDAEVIPPGGACGRHGGRPSRRIMRAW